MKKGEGWKVVISRSRKQHTQIVQPSTAQYLWKNLCDYHVQFQKVVCDEVGGAMSWKLLSLQDIHSSLGFTLEDEETVGEFNQVTGMADFTCFILAAGHRKDLEY